MNTQNKTFSQIINYSESGNCDNNTLRQMVRNYFSRHLIDTSEDYPFYCDIPYYTDGSLREYTTNNHLLRINKIFQDPCKEYIVFVYNEGFEVELDDLSVNDMIAILTTYSELY